MLANNLGAAFTVSLGPFVIGMAVFFAVLMPIFSLETGQSLSAGYILFAIIIMAATTTVLFCWVAVAWHRYALREEHPGRFLPRWHGDAASKYLGSSLRIFFVSIPIGLLLGIVFGVISALAGQGTFISTDGGVLGRAFNFLVGYALLRFALILPTAALGGRMKLGESWTLTEPFAMPVFVAQVFNMGFFSVPFLVAQTPLGASLNSFAYFAVATWLQVMVGISILTTLYGMVVEKRELR